ncbi:MAG: FAD:protein FMN transferase [Sterolibacterium sp.]|jgi:thiamine biosynthesis lipoprotein|nr:FAD:protein FMN transferase [Sterolibacterium sp.]
MRLSVILQRLCLILLACWLAACNPRPAPIVQQESFVFGTRVEVLVYGVSAERGNAAAAEVLREFDRLHRAYHAWQPSELTALNAAIARGQPAHVSTELAELIRNAQKIAAQGDNLFDPGIGHLIALWGFQSDEFKPVLPDRQKLAAWRASHPSIHNLHINGQQVSSDNPQVALDFGGYLKGVALDHAAALLKARGIHNALINIGGNLMALGSKGGTPWRVGIQHPRATTPLASLELHDGEAIGTSGDYQRYFMLDGQRYCHLLDPRTAQPVQETQAVTVLIPPAKDAGMRSDAASKPLFIAGTNWLAEARKLEVAAALRIDATGRVFVTPALQARLKMEDDAPQLTVTMSVQAPR